MTKPDQISGVIHSVQGFTVAELERIWQSMQTNPEAYSLLEKRLACAAVAHSNQRGTAGSEPTCLTLRALSVTMPLSQELS